MKVCLRKGYHHAFDDLLDRPPKGVKYYVPNIVSSHGQSGLGNVLKRKAWRMYSNFFRKPNALSIRVEKGTDLIHSNSGFLIKNDMPWVVDLEHAASFVGFEVGGLDPVKDEVRRYLRSPNCKKIMPWTLAGQRSIENSIGTSGIKKKIEVVYPAMSPSRVKRKKHNGLNVLFVSYGFFNKGGREVLEACESLRNKYDFNLDMVSEVPADYRRKYPDFNYVRPNMPRSKLLNDYFSKADIFVLPSYMDTFGMVCLEAMGAGIPMVTSNVFALPEIVGKSGCLVDVGKYSWYGKDYLFAWKSWSHLEKILRESPKPEITNQISKQIGMLIDSKSTREKMGRNGRREIEKGRFSIENRNRKLGRIYEEAVKR